MKYRVRQMQRINKYTTVRVNELTKRGVKLTEDLSILIWSPASPRGYPSSSLPEPAQQQEVGRSVREACVLVDVGSIDIDSF